MTLRRNIEIKVRVASLENARGIAKSLATDTLGMQTQIDTYFHCANGRLKLREIDQSQFFLIWYRRANQPVPRASDFCLATVAEPETLKQALSGALGVRAVVRKRREVFLYHNVRIHLDNVCEVGTFLEFESVLGTHANQQMGHGQVERLLEAFGVSANDYLAMSYVDLLLDSGGPSGEG